jgi:hypothetical protein
MGNAGRRTARGSHWEGGPYGLFSYTGEICKCVSLGRSESGTQPRGTLRGAASATLVDPFLAHGPDTVIGVDSCDISRQHGPDSVLVA